MDDIEERCNILFALAHCLWQTKELDDDFYAEIKKIISGGEDIAAYRQMGADAKFLREREKALNKLLSDIGAPKETARKRVKPPVPIDSVYRNGCCLAFQYEGGGWGVAITVSCEFYQRKALLYFAQTDVNKNIVPAMNDVQAAHLLDGWFDRSSKYAHHHKLSLYGAHFINSKIIKRLNLYNELFFTIIGYLPEWKDAYSGSSMGIQPYAQENYKEFETTIRRYFTYRFETVKHTRETVAEMNPIFSGI